MRTLMTASALTLRLRDAGVGADRFGSILLEGPPGMAQCSYQTMASARQAKPSGSSSQCVDRTQVQGTVGSGTPAPGGSPTPPAGGSSPSPQR
jgi:hypothetical protein